MLGLRARHLRPLTIFVIVYHLQTHEAVLSKFLVVCAGQSVSDTNLRNRVNIIPFASCLLHGLWSEIIDFDFYVVICYVAIGDGLIDDVASGI